MYVDIANPQWQGKCFGHSRGMRKPQFCVSGKMPMHQHMTIFFKEVLGTPFSCNVSNRVVIPLGIGFNENVLY